MYILINLKCSFLLINTIIKMNISYAKYSTQQLNLLQRTNRISRQYHHKFNINTSKQQNNPINSKFISKKRTGLSLCPRGFQKEQKTSSNHKKNCDIKQQLKVIAAQNLNQTLKVNKRSNPKYNSGFSTAQISIHSLQTKKLKDIVKRNDQTLISEFILCIQQDQQEVTQDNQLISKAVDNKQLFIQNLIDNKHQSIKTKVNGRTQLMQNSINYKNQLLQKIIHISNKKQQQTIKNSNEWLQKMIIDNNGLLQKTADNKKIYQQQQKQQKQQNKVPIFKICLQEFKNIQPIIKQDEFAKSIITLDKNIKQLTITVQDLCGTNKNLCSKQKDKVNTKMMKQKVFNPQNMIDSLQIVEAPQANTFQMDNFSLKDNFNLQDTFFPKDNFGTQDFTLMQSQEKEVYNHNLLKKNQIKQHNNNKLNYNMYRNWKKSNSHKQYNYFQKGKLIQLPLMQKPQKRVSRFSQEFEPKYIKNKVYYFVK